MVLRPSPGPSASVPLSVRSVGRYRLEPGAVETRRPAPALQLFWLAAGSAAFHHRGDATTVAAGQLYAYPAGSPHRIVAGEGGVDYRWWTCDGPAAAAMIAGFGLVPPWPRRAGPPPHERFARLAALLREVGPGAELAAADIGWQLLRRIAEAREASPSADDELVARAARWLERHHADPDCNVAAAARALGVHRSVLARRFATARGQSPVSYLRALRVRRALDLLTGSALPIAEVARRSGFAGSPYLARVIRQATGMSPREVRRG